MPVSRRGFLITQGAFGAQIASAQSGETGAESLTVATPRRADQPIQIASTQSFEPAEIDRIEAAAPGVKLKLYGRGTGWTEILRDAEVVIGELPDDALHNGEKLKWLQASGAGMEWMGPELRRSPLLVTNCARTFAPGITETGMGLLLSLTRGISTYYMPQFYKRRLRPVGTPRSRDHIELAGRTMGIVGLGGIGSAMARRAHHGFDMRVVATDAKPLPKPEYVDELHDPTWFPEMAAKVDVLVAAAPHTPQTESMFNDTIFRSMRKGSYFLALSRGKLYDEMALIRALKEGPLAGAGLDVFPIEPVPDDHAIYNLPNVVMTPHTSGWGQERQGRLIDLYVENIRRYSIGEPLLNMVDKIRGY